MSLACTSIVMSAVMMFLWSLGRMPRTSEANAFNLYERRRNHNVRKHFPILLKIVTFQNESAVSTANVSRFVPKGGEGGYEYFRQQ